MESRVGRINLYVCLFILYAEVIVSKQVRCHGSVGRSLWSDREGNDGAGKSKEAEGEGR